MSHRSMLTLLLVAVLGAGVVVAAPSGKSAGEPASIKAVISAWKGREVRIVRDGDKVEVKVLVRVGEDYLAIDATDGGTTYHPLSRVRAVTAQGDKLFIHVN